MTNHGIAAGVFEPPGPDSESRTQSSGLRTDSRKQTFPSCDHAVATRNPLPEGSLCRAALRKASAQTRKRNPEVRKQIVLISNRSVPSFKHRAAVREQTPETRESSVRTWKQPAEGRIPHKEASKRRTGTIQRHIHTRNRAAEVWPALLHFHRYHITRHGPRPPFTTVRNAGRAVDPPRVTWGVLRHPAFRRIADGARRSPNRSRRDRASLARGR